MEALTLYPEGPCTHIVYTLGPKYLYSDYFKARVYIYIYIYIYIYTHTAWIHGPLGFRGERSGLETCGSRLGAEGLQCFRV